jgi:glycosidase
MEDFIFGTLSTDSLKLLYHRTEQSGIQHAYRMNPQDPKPGDEVTLTVETGSDVLIDQLACYYTLDGRNPKGTRGEAAIGKCVRFELVDITWDTLVWGYKKKWAAQLSPQPEGTEVRYIISGWVENGQEIFADWPDVKSTIEHGAKNYFETKSPPDLRFLGNSSEPKIFNYYVDDLEPPNWAKQAVIYHIFVDRFNPGKDQDWIQTKNPKQAYGGTINGVTEKLDYIQELGADAIWLSPIFPSPSIHRYDATDYYHVAGELGGDEALKDLVAKAHAKGIRIILDLVCNHISFQHPHFLDAYNNKNSQYRDWFYFDETDEIGYRTFFGVRKMPQVNLNHPAARQWMLDIARYWLEVFDIDGYRLDHANGPGPGFWGEFWQLCKTVKPESICFGEVVEPPDVQMQYLGRMDGLLDFHLCEALRKGIGTGKWSLQHFKNFLANHREYWKKDFLMTTFVDNHDMDRFLYVADNDIEKLKRAAEIQFEFPGPPIIYYGTEVGLKQSLSKTSAIGLEASRGAMVWGEEQNEEIFNFYQNLIRHRQITRPWEIEN